MRMKLASLDQLRTQFISDVSHELRTPLTAIKGLAETLQDGAMDDPEVRDRFLASIESETDRLIRLTQDLLTLTRLDSDQLKIELEELDPHSILEQTLISFQASIQKKELLVEISASLDHQCLEAHRDRTIQILNNLLGNAIQSSPHGGRIGIELRVVDLEEPSTQRYLTHSQAFSGYRPTSEQLSNREWILIRIHDEGPGIKAMDLPHIFERFYRADQARSRSEGGAGLGLAIALALTKALNGYLWISSPVIHFDGDASAGTDCFLILPTSRS
jgi:signal transduction histidine kinase